TEPELVALAAIRVLRASVGIAGVVARAARRIRAREADRLPLEVRDRAAVRTGAGGIGVRAAPHRALRLVEGVLHLVREDNVGAIAVADRRGRIPPDRRVRAETASVRRGVAAPLAATRRVDRTILAACARSVRERIAVEV